MDPNQKPKQQTESSRVERPEGRSFPVKSLSFPPGVIVEIPGRTVSGSSVTAGGAAPQARTTIEYVPAWRAFCVTAIPPGKDHGESKWISEAGCSWVMA